MGEARKDALRLAFRRIYSISLAFFARNLADYTRIFLTMRCHCVIMRLETRRSVSVKCIWEIPVGIVEVPP